MTPPNGAAPSRGPGQAPHPCFSAGHSGNVSRIHLPVAPRCNVRCNFCLRRFDCANESRPGVTTRVIGPAEALDRFLAASRALGNLRVAGVAGPGDALANFPEVKETFRLVREADAGAALCLSTNGLLLPALASELKELTLTHLTVTVNAVDPAVGARIYASVGSGAERLTGEAGARRLVESQLAGIRLARGLGIEVKVNCVMIKGVNDGHVERVAETAAGLGAGIFNIVGHIPVAGTPFGSLAPPSPEEIRAVRERCARHLPQMGHCMRCRADALGPLGPEPEATAATTAPPGGARPLGPRPAAAGEGGCGEGAGCRCH